MRQFVRFCFVGLIQNGLNIGIFAAQVAAGVPYLLASAASACCALAVSFLLNRRWTFQGTNDRTRARAVRYVAIWLIVLLAALPVLALLVDVAHIPKVLAQAIVIAVGAPISYLAQRRWTFSNSVR